MSVKGTIKILGGQNGLIQHILTNWMKRRRPDAYPAQHLRDWVDISWLRVSEVFNNRDWVDVFKGDVKSCRLRGILFKWINSQPISFFSALTLKEWDDSIKSGAGRILLSKEDNVHAERDWERDKTRKIRNWLTHRLCMLWLYVLS